MARGKAHQTEPRVERLLENGMCRIQDQLGQEDLVAALVDLQMRVVVSEVHLTIRLAVSGGLLGIGTCWIARRAVPWVVEMGVMRCVGK